jgi:hypothetical protein
MSEEEWEYNSDEGIELVEEFPIGYTIDFCAEDRDAFSDDAETGQAPRGGLGSQALPVSESLRDDWDGVPTDGAEYLFTVRYVLSLSLSYYLRISSLIRLESLFIYLFSDCV